MKVKFFINKSSKCEKNNDSFRTSCNIISFFIIETNQLKTKLYSVFQILYNILFKKFLKYNRFIYCKTCVIFITKTTTLSFFPLCDVDDFRSGYFKHTFRGSPFVS